MWIGSVRNHKAKPFGIKWPAEPIKTLGVYFTYDQKFLNEDNFIERLDSVKNLINIWSSRGLSIYGKVTIIKSFLIPKFVYVCLILPTPKELVKELNRLLFKLLWNSTEKVERASVINEYEEGGLKMIDLECMVKSLRLAWLRRIFNGINGTWKSCLHHLLSPFGNFLFWLVIIISLIIQFLLNSITNSCRDGLISARLSPIDNKPVYYRNYHGSGIIYTKDLLFNLNVTDSYNYLSKK